MNDPPKMVYRSTKADQNDDALYGEGGEEDEDEPEPLESLDEEDE